MLVPFDVTRVSVPLLALKMERHLEPRDLGVSRSWKSLEGAPSLDPQKEYSTTNEFTSVQENPLQIYSLKNYKVMNMWCFKAHLWSFFAAAMERKVTY